MRGRLRTNSPLRSRVYGIQKTAYMGKMVRGRQKCVVNARELTEYKRYIPQKRKIRRNMIEAGLLIRANENIYWWGLLKSPVSFAEI